MQRSGVCFQHFLDEPGADAMSHQEHARVGTVRDEQIVEELNVRLDLRRQGHGRGIAPPMKDKRVGENGYG
jgi:hypothetical protein